MEFVMSVQLPWFQVAQGWDLSCHDSYCSFKELSDGVCHVMTITIASGSSVMEFVTS